MSAVTIIAAIDAINEQIKSHQDEIDRLVTARDTLGTLVSIEEAKPIRRAKLNSDTVKAPKVEQGPVIATGKIVIDEDTPTESPRRSRRRKMTPSEAGEAFVKSTVAQSTRKSTGKSSDKRNLANLEKARAAKAAKSNGKATRRDQIIELLTKGKSPREIGDKLGIAPNYVYHVKRSIA